MAKTGTNDENLASPRLACRCASTYPCRDRVL